MRSIFNDIERDVLAFEAQDYYWLL